MAEFDEAGDAIPTRSSPTRRRAWLWLLAVLCGVAAASVVIAVRIGDDDGDGDEATSAPPASIQATTVPTPTASPVPDPTPTALPTQTPTPRPTATPSPYEDCDIRLGLPSQGDTPASQVSFAAALELVGAGDVLCVMPGRHDEVFVVDRSGEDGRPITIRGFEGTSVLALEVVADDVVVEGFDVSGRGGIEAPGIFIDGSRIVVRDNAIHDMVGIGVKCAQAAVDEPPRCVDAVIEDNIIWAIDGWGIWVRGDGNLVTENEIYGVFAATHDDADAIRFFGSNHVLRGNYVHDIDEGDARNGREPHSDCFQTFDGDGSHPALENIVIADNVCSVDRHGVIMNSLAGRPATGIRIENNVFEIHGAAVGLLLGDFEGPVGQIDDLVVANNLVTGTIDFHGVQVHNAVNVQMFNNLFLGDFEPASGAGLTDARGSVFEFNLRATPDDFADLAALDVRERYLLAAGSMAIDVGRSAGAPVLDLTGTPRPADGNGDGVAEFDIGPYEYQDDQAPGRPPEEQ